MLKRLALLTVLIAAVSAVACDDNKAEQGQAIFGVSDINGNNPVTVTGGAGSTLEMTFRWRPFLDPDARIVAAAPHGDYTIESYRITWTAVTPGATVPSPRDEVTHIFLPVYELVTAGIIVLTPAEAAAVSAGSVLDANIEFTAREMGTTRDAKFSAKFSVTFN
ncbi:MAG TPA: hypothetical protein VJS69_01640 [Candidatus Krumholzibacteria bacterium]|nr:hypothetical protein [Candidatus Krumholzibacteria bacterium]